MVLESAYICFHFYRIEEYYKFMTKLFIVYSTAYYLRLVSSALRTSFKVCFLPWASCVMWNKQSGDRLVVKEKKRNNNIELDIV